MTIKGYSKVFLTRMQAMKLFFLEDESAFFAVKAKFFIAFDMGIAYRTSVACLYFMHHNLSVQKIEIAIIYITLDYYPKIL